MNEPRLLLLRFSAIGDCVMAAWTASSFRAAYPRGVLCWTVESRCAPVVDTSQLVNELWEIPRDRWKKHRWSPATWREQVLRYTGLRKLNFDFGLDLQGHSKTALCLRLASPKQRLAGRATDGLARRLNPTLDRPAGVHTVDWQRSLLTKLGLEAPEVSPIMPVKHNVLGEGRWATIAVSAGHPSKALPAETWREVARGLIDKSFQVAFLGGPTDTPIHESGTLDLVGKLPLTDTMSAVAQSAIHFAADTGTGHMAAAYGVPVVSVFGPTDPDEFRPYAGEKGRVLTGGVQVTPDQIVREGEELLEALSH